MFGLFSSAAKDLNPGESVKVACESEGLSFTVSKREDGSCNISGDNEKSKKELKKL